VLQESLMNSRVVSVFCLLVIDGFLGGEVKW